MNTFRVWRGVFLGALFPVLSGCGAALTGASYSLITPPVPETWLSALGEPVWRIEWVDPDGAIREAERYAPFDITITVPQAAATPVSAFPFWPGKGIRPAVFRAAGGMFPLDVEGGAIRLSWQGGVDAHFYKLLSDEAKGKRLPQNFDWKRFRALFAQEKLKQEIRDNPWIVDWPFAAKKAVDSSFSVNHVKPRKRAYVTVDIPAAGPWISVSPFACDMAWEKARAENVPVFEETDVFFCPGGFLRCGNGVWVFRPYP